MVLGRVSIRRRGTSAIVIMREDCDNLEQVVKLDIIRLESKVFELVRLCP